MRRFWFSAGVVVAAVGLTVACSGASGSEGAGGAGGSSAGQGGAAAGGAGGTLGGSGGASASGGSGGGFQGCTGTLYDGTLVPLDMFVMFDKSASMTQGGYWGPVTSALSQFVALQDAYGIGVGLAFFPRPYSTRPQLPARCQTTQDCGAYGPCMPGFFTCLGAISTDSCVSVDYSTPVVPIAPLPGNTAAIQNALATASPNGDTTPTSAALEGAINYARVWAADHPDHITIVVLATDGEPTGCSVNRVDTAAAFAELGLNNVPSVKTFVIGMGNLSALNLIAQKGGTGQALIIGSGNPGQEFLDRMNEIRGAIGCNYNIPAPPVGQELDFGKVNVTFTPETGGTEILPRVDGPGACQGNPGWYYDNPAAPTKIQLCPSSCDRVDYLPGKVEVVLGCVTIIG